MHLGGAAHLRALPAAISALALNAAVLGGRDARSLSRQRLCHTVFSDGGARGALQPALRQKWAARGLRPAIPSSSSLQPRACCLVRTRTAPVRLDLRTQRRLLIAARQAGAGLGALQLVVVLLELLLRLQDAAHLRQGGGERRRPSSALTRQRQLCQRSTSR